MTRSYYRRRVAAALSVAAVLLATGCATLPTTTEPQVLKTFEPDNTAAPVESPRPGTEADLLLREFYAVSANPSSDFRAARSYLTEPMSQSWKPTDSVLVLDTIDITTQPTQDSGTRSFSVSGRVIGNLRPGGAFEPESGQYEATMELTQEDGEWRIAALPNQVVVDRTEMRNHYQPFNIYYYDAAGQTLIPDRRWVFTRVSSLGTTLLNMLVNGPAEAIAPAVSSAIPEDVTFTGYEDGVYEFGGLAQADEPTRARFAAQVVWTLSGAGVPGPYAIKGDGAALVGDSVELTTDDFADLNPVPTAEEGPDLYTLSDGAVSSVTGLDEEATPEVEPVEDLAELGNISMIDIGDDGKFAASVNINDDEQALVAGTLGESSRELLRAETLTRPSLEPGHRSALVVIDGDRVVRGSRSPATGEITINDVDIELPEDLDGDISVLRLSHTGARVAMIVDGWLAVGVVGTAESGQRSIVNVRRYAPELDGAAVTADWQPDGSLLVGTSIKANPIVRVDQDGFSVTPLPSGNVSGPVVAVGATKETMYVTDSKVIMRMPSASQGSLNWREVPGLQGVRAAPVVTRP